MTLQFSKGIVQKISKWRWFSFLKMQKKVAPKLKLFQHHRIIQKKILQMILVSKKNISVIPNGIDYSSFTPLKDIQRVPWANHYHG